MVVIPKHLLSFGLLASKHNTSPGIARYLEDFGCLEKIVCNRHGSFHPDHFLWKKNTEEIGFSHVSELPGNLAFELLKVEAMTGPYEQLSGGYAQVTGASPGKFTLDLGKQGVRMDKRDVG